MKILVWSGLVEPNNTRALVYDDGSVMLLCDNPTDAQRVAALSAAVSLLGMMTGRPLQITPGDATLVLKETSTLVLDQEEFDAIREACECVEDHGADFAARQLAMYERHGHGEHPLATALRILANRSSSASLVRGLLVRAGFVAGRVRGEPTLDAFFYDKPKTLEIRVPSGTSVIGYMTWTVDAADVPRLISALADLAPGDKEGATRALMEAGR